MLNIFTKKHPSENDNIDENDLNLNSSEVQISNIEQSLTNWTIPKQDIKTVYKIGTFDYFQGYSIKATEQTVSINKDYSNLTLLSKSSIIQHRQKYKFLHVGLVQVAIKPLFRLGIDAPVLLILRDARHTNFQNSILAMAETNVSNGPIYFNCYPNFSVGLFDPNILDTLVLTIKTKNLEFKEDTKPVAVIYRVCYKTMTSTIEPKTRITSPRDETLLIEANSQHTKTQIPKKLKWNEITQSCNWNLQDIGNPKPIDNSNNISNITEHEDGSVDINFSNFNLEDLRSSSSRISTGSISRTKTPSFQKSQSINSHSLRFKNVDFNRQIPQVFYQEESDDNQSYNYEPTTSEIQAEINQYKAQQNTN